MAGRSSGVGIALLFIFVLAILIVLAIAATQGKSIVSSMINNQMMRLGAPRVSNVRSLIITAKSGSLPLEVGPYDLTVIVSPSEGELTLHVQAAGASSVGRKIEVRNKGTKTVKVVAGRRVKLVGDSESEFIILPGKTVSLVGTSADTYIVHPSN